MKENSYALASDIDETIISNRDRQLDLIDAKE